MGADLRAQKISADYFEYEWFALIEFQAILATDLTNLSAFLNVARELTC